MKQAKRTGVDGLMFLFLDFDGVLHPHFARADRTDEENLHFSYLPRLEAVLRQFPGVKIVIASDWRKRHSLAELRRMFSEDLRFHIAGVIGIDDADQGLGNRQRLIERYLAEQRSTGSPWLAIDDDAGNYLPGAPLVLCDDGFRDEEERALRDSLAGKVVNSAARVLAAAGTAVKGSLNSTARLPSRWSRRGARATYSSTSKCLGRDPAAELIKTGRRNFNKTGHYNNLLDTRQTSSRQSVLSMLGADAQVRIVATAG